MLFTPTHAHISRTNLQLAESMRADRHGDEPVTIADAPVKPGSERLLRELHETMHADHLAAFACGILRS